MLSLWQNDKPEIVLTLDAATPISIGRRKTCTFVLNDVRVSGTSHLDALPHQSSCPRLVTGVHAVFSCNDDGCFITDHSMNGTWVNGKQLTKGEMTLLKANDVKPALPR